MKENSWIFPLMLMVLTGLSGCIKDEPPTIKLEPAAKTSAVNDTNVFNPNLTYGSVSDIDGNIYETIQISNQTWMAENLKTTMYNDGSPMAFATGGPAGYSDWFDYGDGNYKWFDGAYCWYDNDKTNKDAYGALYNWHAVGTGKLCPTGWHVPAYSEWTELITSLGGSVGFFNELTKNAKINWGNYVRGFTIVPAGELCGWGFIQNQCCWWTATPRVEKPDHIQVVPFAYLLNFEYFGFEPKSGGYNVRCVKD